MNHLLKVLQGETLQGCRVSPCSRGFTLIELLVVIAILGILSAGILTAINVTSNLDKAKLAKAKTFSKSLENALSVSQVGKWSFEQVTNNKTPDTSGHGNDATLTGGAAITANCQNIGLGQCLSLNGTSAYIDLPENNQFNSIGAGPFTMAAWVNLQEPVQAHNRFLVLQKNCSDTRLASLIFLNSQKFNFGLGGGVEAVIGAGSITTTDTYKYGNWYFVSGTRDSLGNIKLYIDGVLKGQATSRLDLGNSLACNRIGRLGGEYTNGLIDEVAIYSQALTASQIQHLYAQGLPRHQLAKKQTN